MNLSKTMNFTISRVFTANLQQEDAEMIIRILSKRKDEKAQRLAADLDERFRWNYRTSAIRKSS